MVKYCLRHFIRAFIVCQSTRLGVSVLQMVNLTKMGPSSYESSSYWGYCEFIEPYPFNPFSRNGISHSSIGLVHYRFKGCWVVFFNFIQILIGYSVSKQWRPWSDAAFCGVWSSDLGMHCLPMSHKKDARLIWVNIILYKLLNSIYPVGWIQSP